MSDGTPINIPLRVDVQAALTVEQIVEWFASASSDDQARFFQEVAEQTKAWDHPPMRGKQWHYIIGAVCNLGFDDARELLQEWAEYFERSAWGSS